MGRLHWMWYNRVKCLFILSVIYLFVSLFAHAQYMHLRKTSYAGPVEDKTAWYYVFFSFLFIIAKILLKHADLELRWPYVSLDAVPYFM